jgi:isoleucyl-tRNA synthetase
MLQIRDICNLSIEEKRSNKEIGSSLEVNLKIELDQKLFDLCKNVDFAELCITSSAELKVGSGEETKAITKKRLEKNAQCVGKLVKKNAKGIKFSF